MRARKGPEQATVATAHKIARIVYHLLKYGAAYQAERVAAYAQQRQARERRRSSGKPPILRPGSGVGWLGLLGRVL
jgi:hypothetical protein